MHAQEFPLETIGSRTIFENKWIRLDEETVRDRSGATRPYVLSSAKEYVIVVPVNRKGEVLLLRQYKHGARKYVLTFPAGYCEEGEEPRDAAARELLEETGFKGADVCLLGVMTENHTTSRSSFSVFIAEDCEGNAEDGGNPDEDEANIERLWLPVSALLTKEILAQMPAAPVVSAIPWLLDYLHSTVDS